MILCQNELHTYLVIDYTTYQLYDKSFSRFFGFGVCPRIHLLCGAVTEGANREARIVDDDSALRCFQSNKDDYFGYNCMVLRATKHEYCECYLLCSLRY